MAINWKSIVGTVAPTIASALGGPLAGVAVKALGTKLLGKEDATEEEVSTAILSASPESLLKLKELESEFALKMAELGVELDKIEAGDRDSARKRQVDMKDWTPNVLAGAIVIGYLSVQWYVLGHTLPVDNQTIIIRTLGTLDAVVMMVMAYFFGSSRGSKHKTEILGKIKNGH